MYRVPNVMHEELLNWSRWAWLGAWPHPLPATQCGSAEGEYRVPEWEALGREEPVQRPIRPNERNARIVDDVWRGIQRSLAGLVLKAEYPGRDTSGRNESRAKAAANLKMTVQAYEGHLRTAVAMVEQAFENANRRTGAVRS